MSKPAFYGAFFMNCYLLLPCTLHYAQAKTCEMKGLLCACISETGPNLVVNS